MVAAKDDARVSIPVFPQHPDSRGDQVVIEVDGPLLAGPVGPRVAVFDYNRDLDELFPPATPRADGTFPDYDPSDLRFHQLNAYAVTARAIEFVEGELGRSLSWGFDGGRLIVLPHAGHMANAFYSEFTNSTQFYSFTQRRRETRPDGTRERDRVYHTSLVHDIVAHEAGHALLDATRDRFTEALEPETAAIHEAVGDLTAVFAALGHDVVLNRLLKESSDDLRRHNVVAAIAEEFREEGSGGRVALRNLTEPHSPSYYRNVVEPHEKSLQMTQAIWEALARMYDINRALGEPPRTAIRLAHRVLQRMAVRALDYLPPADATFVEFAVAMLQADKLSHPKDARDYRRAVAGAFVALGIGKNQASLLADTADGVKWTGRPANWPGLGPTEAYRFLDRHRNKLALSRHPQYRDFVVRSYEVKRSAREPDEVDSVTFVYEYPVDIELRGRRFGYADGKWISVIGGGTLVFDADGRLRHHAEKPVTKGRVTSALDFVGGALGTDMTMLEATEEDQVRRHAARRPFLLEISQGAATVRTNLAAACGRAAGGGA